MLLHQGRKHRTDELPGLATAPVKRALLGREEERALLVAAREQGPGGPAEAELLERNWRLVTAMARRWGQPTFPYEDACQEAAISFLTAVRKFDLARDVKLATYAVTWMRQGLNRATENQSRLIRVPAHALELQRKIALAEHKLHNCFGREPSQQELADEVCLDLEVLEALQRAVQQPLSLDAPWSGGGDDDQSLIELVVTQEPRLEDEVPARLERAAALDALMVRLTDTERGVLERRFGVPPYDAPQTLAEVARVLGLSREGARQVEVRAKKKCQATAEGLDIRLEDLL